MTLPIHKFLVKPVPVFKLSELVSLRLVFVFLSLFVSTQGSSLPWKVSEKLQTAKEIALLRVLHPNINTAAELSQLIGRFSLVGSLEFMYVEHRGDHWYVSGEYAPEIAAFDVKLPTLFLNRVVSTVSANYIGEVDNSATKSNLKKRLKEKLKASGYPFAKIAIVSQPHPKSVEYQLVIDEGIPCTIESIIYSFELPLEIESVKAGELCELERIDFAIRKLEERLQDVSYADARVEFGGLRIDKNTGKAKLLIKGSLGEKVVYRIKDTKSQFSLDDLFSENNIRFDPNFVSPDAMVSEIRRTYQNNAYADTTIDGPIKSYDASKTVVYTYIVDPGPIYKISTIAFDGLSIFSEEEASNLIGISSFWQANPILNLEKIRSGLETLKSEYLSRGFWDIKIREPKVTRDSLAGTAQIVVVVDEGLPHVLNKFEIKNNGSIQFPEIRDNMSGIKNDPLNKEIIFNTEDEIKRTYISEGYLYAQLNKKISRTLTRKHQGVDIEFEVTEGPRVKIGYIEIEGLNKTSRLVVERELLFKTGDWYLPKKITETRRRIINTGVFGAVQIQPVDRNDLVTESRVVDLKISVREKIPGQVSFGPGYQIGKGFQYVAETSYANIGGLGRRISFRSALSQEKSQQAIDNRTLLGRKFGIGYLEPHILSTDLDLRTSISHKAVATSYWDNGYAGEIALIQEMPILEKNFPSELRYFYSIKLNREEGTPEQTRYILTEGDIRIGALGVGYKFDTRNSPAWPTDGTLFEAELRLARYELGGNVAYNRLHIEQSFFRGISRDWVFLGSYGATTITGIDRSGAEAGLSVLPASERLYAGGADQVRGFIEPLGPFLLYEALREDNGINTLETQKEVIGGTHRFVLKMALRYRIDESYGLFTFADLGNSYSSKREQEKFGQRFSSTEADSTTGRFRPSVEENFIYSFENVLSKPSLLVEKNYMSYGFGMNLLTPFGTASFYYALPWKQPESSRCSREDKACLDRRKTGDTYLFRGEIGLNIGKKF